MRRIITFLLILLTLTACEDKASKGKRRSTSNVASAPWELLVVANKDWLAGSYGSALMDVVKSDVPGLPQVEPCFRVTAINPRDFEKTFKAYANIIMAEVNPKYTEAGMALKTDEYAHPQYVLTITAPTNEAFAAYVEANKARILSVFVVGELTRERSYLDKHYSGKVLTEACRKFGCELKSPEDITAVKTGKDFLWGTSESGEGFNSNVCVYSYPYTTTDAFTADYFLAKRDSVMKINLQGGREDQYVSADRATVTTTAKTVDGRYVMEVRGLWQMENDFMGGPFVAYSQVDTLNNRILVVEGFVYAPEKKKRNLIRTLEASLQTLVLPSKKSVSGNK